MNYFFIRIDELVCNLTSPVLCLMEKNIEVSFNIPL